MPKKQFALEKGGPKRVLVSWKGMWKNFSVELDGAPLGTVENQKMLKAGQDFPLGDGTTLRVQLKTGLSGELQLTRDGHPLPGSGADPEVRLKTAWGVLFFVAGVNAVLGIAAEAFDVEILLALGLGYTSLAIAVVFGGLGFAVKTYRSQVALIVAIVLFALDGLLVIFAAMEAGGRPGVGGIIMRVLLLMAMIQGVGAIKALKQESGS